MSNRSDMIDQGIGAIMAFIVERSIERWKTFAAYDTSDLAKRNIKQNERRKTIEY